MEITLFQDISLDSVIQSISDDVPRMKSQLLWNFRYKTKSGKSTKLKPSKQRFSCVFRIKYLLTVFVNIFAEIVHL